MSQTVFTSASPPGSGRSFDAWIDIPTMCVFPVTQGFAQNWQAFNEVRCAGTAAAGYSNFNAAFGTPNAGNTKVGLYRGRMCARLSNVGGLIQCNIVPLIQQFQKPPFNITNDGPFVWRYIAVVATGPCAVIANPGDNGLLFQPGVVQSGQVEGGAGFGGRSGFGFFWDGAGIPNWVSHRNLASLAPDEVVPLATVPDNDWHSVEIRITGATQQSDAQVVLVYDGISLIQRNWAAGTLLPDFSSDPNLMQLTCVFMNGNPGFPSNVYMSEFRVMGGPTLSSLF
jgi:hypothetical protein